MPNPIYMIAGKPFLGPSGQMVTKHVGAAPNGLDIGTVTVYTRPSSGTRYLIVTSGSTLSASVTAMNLIFFFDGHRPISWPFPTSTLDLMKAGTGEFVLGEESAVLGPRAGTTITRVRAVPANSSGDGACADAPLVLAEAPETTDSPSIESVSATGTALVGSLLTATAVAVTGSPAPTLSYQWRLAGVAIGGATSQTYTPVATGSHTCYVTATNSVGAFSIESNAIAVESAPGVSGVAVAGSGFKNTVHTVNFTPSGLPAPTPSFEWFMGASPVGTNANTYTPVADGTLTCKVTVTNAHGSANATSAGVTITTQVGNSIPVISSLTIVSAGTLGLKGVAHTASFSVAGLPAPSLAYQWFIDAGSIVGATSSSYTPTQNSGSLTVQVTATNSEGSDQETSAGVSIVSAPAITASSISGGTIVGSTLTASHTATGNPTPTITRQWYLGSTAITGATGTTYVPSTAGTYSCLITATNTHGSTTAQPSVVITAPAALTASQWSILAVAAAPSVNATARRWTEIGILPATGAVRAWWTTQTPEFLAVNPFPAGWVEMTLTGTSGGWLRWDPNIAYAISASPGPSNVGNGVVSGGVARSTNAGTITLTATSSSSLTVSGLISGTATVGTEFASGSYRFTPMGGSTPFSAGDTFTLSIGDWDFSVFDPSPPGTRLADALRQGRAALCYAVTGGARAPKSEDVKTVPDLPVSTNPSWYPFMGRSATQFADGFIGGDGRQNFKFTARSAADPAVVWWGLDVNGPVATKNGGGWYYSPPLRGMPINECSAGIWLDPQDADRVLVATSAADLRSTTTTPNKHDLRAGIYLSLDGGETATHVLQLTNVRSCGATGERDNMQLFVALSGGSPTTRTIYYAFKPRPKGGAWGTGTLYRSTNGGSTWAAHGASLTNATFGDKVYWIDRDPNNNLYLGCDNGLFKSTDGGTSWAACSGIAGPVTVVNAYHGGTNIWAVRQGNGVYQATNAAGTAFSRNAALGAYEARFVAVCPADPQRIIAARSGAGNKGKRSVNGGTSWTDMVHKNYDGDTNDFSTYFCHETALASWTPGSTTEIILQLKQRFGKSIDAAANTFDSSNGTDYRTRRGMGFDPVDWKIMISGMTDVGGLFSDNAMDTAQNCKLTDAQRTTAINGSHHLVGTGGLILKNGTHRAYLTGAGGSSTDITPMRWTFDGTIGSGTFLNSSNRSGERAGRDWTDASVGWMGACRITLSSGGVASIDASMAQDFFGASGTTLRIFGGAPGGSSSSIYVSTNGGTSWTLWGTSPVRYRIQAGSPYAIWVSKHSANRVYVGEAYNGTGRVYRMEGATPTNTLLFTLANFPGFDAAETVIHRVVDCPLDPTVLYVMAFVAGNSMLFRITDVLTTPVVEDITGNAPLRAISWMYVHDLTGDVIIGGQCGSRIHRCGPSSTGTDAGKLFDRVKAYVDANLGPGVEI